MGHLSARGFAEFVSIEVEEDEGLFEIGYGATDICDPNSIVTAVIEVPLPADAADWDIELSIEDKLKLEVETEEKRLEIKGPNPEDIWAQTQELGGIMVENGQLIK